MLGSVHNIIFIHLGRLIASSLVQLIYIVKYHWTEYLALNSLDYKWANCGFYKLWSDMVRFRLCLTQNDFSQESEQ